jgi:thiamine-monophosphate kinase
MAAMSDLAAEGAQPLGLLISVGTPRELDESDLAELMKGAGGAVRALGTSILGGDLSRSALFVVDCCALGWAERPVRRVGASTGDGLWVTGALGGPRAAVEAWRAGSEPEAGHRARFARPEARLGMGRWLAAHGAKAMIDVSDGLAADAGHLAAASGVRAVLELDRVPLVDGVDDPLLAAASGEEYELLAAMPAGFGGDEETPVPFTCVGTCEEGKGVETMLAGRAVSPPAGFDHFAG